MHIGDTLSLHSTHLVGTWTKSGMAILTVRAAATEFCLPRSRYGWPTTLKHPLTRDVSEWNMHPPWSACCAATTCWTVLKHEHLLEMAELS